jgi:hypothetical protein
VGPGGATLRARAHAETFDLWVTWRELDRSAAGPRRSLARIRTNAGAKRTRLGTSVGVDACGWGESQ